MNAEFKHIAKAIVGALIAGLGAVATGLEDGYLNPQEIITAVVAFLTAGGVVFGVPNGPKPGDGA